MGKEYSQLRMVLDNFFLNNTHTFLKPIDLALIEHGLHDYGWWDTQPYGMFF